MSNLSPWEALNLENDHPNKDEQEQIRLNIKRKFKMCFESPEGKWVLEYLNGRYFNRPIVDEHAVNVLASAGIREGELRILRFIHQIMQQEG